MNVRLDGKCNECLHHEDKHKYGKCIICNDGDVCVR